LIEQNIIRPGIVLQVNVERIIEPFELSRRPSDMLLVTHVKVLKLLRDIASLTDKEKEKRLVNV
jgi:hypothetical protein